MTAQFPDCIRITGRKQHLYATPLDQYFELAGIEPDFETPSTALWRGYVATWEIVEDRLYLIDVESHLPGDRTGTLGDLFPGFPDRVFAHWYHGDLRIPQGPEVGYIHAGFGAIHESMLCITVRGGVVTGRRVEQRSAEDA